MRYTMKKKINRDIYYLYIYWEACELAQYRNLSDFEEYNDAVEEIYDILLEKYNK